MHKLIKLFSILSVLSVAACAHGQEHKTPTYGNGASVGTLGGAVLGALAGKKYGDKNGGRALTTIGGALVGAVAGNVIGQQFDAPTGQPIVSSRGYQPQYGQQQYGQQQYGQPVCPAYYYWNPNTNTCIQAGR